MHSSTFFAGAAIAAMDADFVLSYVPMNEVSAHKRLHKKARSLSKTPMPPKEAETFLAQSGGGLVKPTLG
jgi:hypothetical protein